VAVSSPCWLSGVPQDLARHTSPGRSFVDPRLGVPHCGEPGPECRRDLRDSGDKGLGGVGDNQTTRLWPGDCWNMCGGTQVRGSHRCAGTGERDTGAGPPLTGSDSNAKQRVVLGDKVSDLSSAESPGATLVSRRSQRPLAWRASVPGHRNRGGAQWCGGFEYNRSVTQFPPKLKRLRICFLSLSLSLSLTCLLLFGFSLCDTCQTMLSLLILLSHLPTVTLAFPHCTRSLEDSGYAGEEGKYAPLTFRKKPS
jgi:hypothetical protein